MAVTIGAKTVAAEKASSGLHSKACSMKSVYYLCDVHFACLGKLLFASNDDCERTSATSQFMRVASYKLQPSILSINAGFAESCHVTHPLNALTQTDRIAVLNAQTDRGSMLSNVGLGPAFETDV